MNSRYDLMSLIGEGAYGSVYKARRKSNNEIVAIKKFKDNTDKENNFGIKRTIMREIKMLRQLQNPEFVVILQDQFKRRGRVHLVFEYIDQSLLDLLDANAAGLNAGLVNDLLIQLLNAIKWCHCNNIIHRDIKPENLLVDSKTHKLKLCDFGFARHLQKHDDSAVTEYVATRWYRAPELLVGAKQHTTAVDVWPVGCIWVEMCSSDALFPGNSEIDQLYIIQDGIGTCLPRNLVKFFKTNAKYQGLSLPNQDLYSNDATSSLQKMLRKQHHVSLDYFQQQNRLELLVKMLRIDPDSRITIDDAIYAIENPEKERAVEPKLDEKRRRVNKRYRVKQSKMAGEKSRERSPRDRKLKLPQVGHRRKSIVGIGLSDLLDMEPSDGEESHASSLPVPRKDLSQTNFHTKTYFLKKKGNE